MIQCGQCKGRLALPRDKELFDKFFDKCPFCWAEWLQSFGTPEPYQDFLHSLRKVKELEEGNFVPFSIRLAYDHPSFCAED